MLFVLVKKLVPSLKRAWKITLTYQWPLLLWISFSLQSFPFGDVTLSIITNMFSVKLLMFPIKFCHLCLFACPAACWGLTALTYISLPSSTKVNCVQSCIFLIQKSTAVESVRSRQQEQPCESSPVNHELLQPHRDCFTSLSVAQWRYSSVNLPPLIQTRSTEDLSHIHLPDLAQNRVSKSIRDSLIINSAISHGYGQSGTAGTNDTFKNITEVRRFPGLLKQ